MARIRINARKEYREQLRTFLTLSRFLLSKLNDHNRKYQKRAVRDYMRQESIDDDYYEKYGQDLYKILERNATRVIREASRRIRSSKLLQEKDDEVDLAIWSAVSS